ncbi:LpqB family beta-propeller domain-containing protein [Streptomyces sp. NPDC001744]|uniref:LpqB family beta-propeller domain-containing protein n=1 Tax=Streptomyces sp. NPDC001744 TaxID=3364606 RepID=UPI0036BB3D48
MGADARTERAGRARGGRAVVLSACGALLAAGCATMPDDGSVEAVKGSTTGDSQVRVYAVAPRENADPGEIVDGFLEAMTSDDLGFATARKYLTQHAAETWKPEEGITVLTAAPSREQAGRNGDPDKEGRSYSLTGRKIATVDARHAYQPISPKEYLQTIHVVQQPAAGGKGKEWRINSLPPGLLLGEADFLRNYRSVNKYYFASGKDWVVADPVYIRQRQDPVTRMDPVTQTVKTLLDGPTNWLKPAVDSSFPPRTELRKGVTTLATDDQSTLKVPLNAKADGADGPACRRMAAQLLFTLRDLPSVRVEQVELLGSKGSLCRLGQGQAAEFAPVRNGGRGENAYFLDGHDKLRKLMAGEKEASAPVEVPGPFGRGPTRLGSVAVDRDETRAAGVDTTGHQLFVSSITVETGQEPPPAVLSSKAVKPVDRLSTPTWDGQGDLWVADRDPAERRLWMVPGGTGKPVEVGTPWLGDGRIESLRVSADGVRMALVVRRGERTTLQIGRIERRTTDGGTVVSASVADLQPAAPRMESVTAVSWAGPSRLVVVGREAGGVQQIRYLQTDGSTSASSVLPGLNGASSVSAPHDESAATPVVADSEDGIVRLPPGTNWQPVVKTGSSPVYPG